MFALNINGTISLIFYCLYFQYHLHVNKSVLPRVNLFIQMT